MPISRDAPDVLSREYLEIRSRLLDVAAALDRIDRAEGLTSDDVRRQNIARALDALGGSAPNRAEQVQTIFSRAYDARWRENLDVKRQRAAK